ncbi:hypothetical protein, partial [Aquitalea magnusonii]|uniref:hypothetical protein n=1 Tax=Aquitalea magnusonii TaxID=332411 RepID=UPI001379C08C
VSGLSACVVVPPRTQVVVQAGPGGCRPALEPRRTSVSGLSACVVVPPRTQVVVQAGPGGCRPALEPR